MHRVSRTLAARRHVGEILRNAGLRRVMLAFGVFRPIESAQWLAILVFAYRTGGPQQMGIAAMFLLIPAVLIAPFAAELGDRTHRERALAIGYLLQGVAMGATAFGMAADASPLAVYGLAAVANAAITLTRPVHLAILPQLAESPAQLTLANSMSTSIEGLAVFVGPLFAGILLQIGGPEAVFAPAAIALVAVGTLVLFVHARAAAAPHTGERVRGAFEGFRELRRRRGARLLLGFVAGETGVIGALDILVVTLAFGVFQMGESGPGVLSAAVGIGGLFGAAATVTLIGRDRLSSPFFLGVLGIGLPIALVAVVPGPAVAILLLMASGIGKSFFDVSARTMLQRSVDDRVLARVFGVQEALNMAALAVGSLAGPLLVSALDERLAFVVVGLSLPLIAVVGVRRIRSVDDETVSADRADIDLLRRTQIFAPLGPVAIDTLALALQRVDVASGDVVIREGDEGDLFYVVAEGTVKVTRDEAHVADLGPGDYFGEIALLRGVPRTATVTASAPCSLRTLERDRFLEAMTGSATGADAADEEARRRLSMH
jgi:MFS family permease